MNSVFLLRAHAACNMLRQRKIRCCRAAGKPAIRADCSKDQRSNSQTADFAAIYALYAKSRFVAVAGLVLREVVSSSLSRHMHFAQHQSW